MSEDITPELRAAIAADPFAQHIGATLDEVRPGYARMSVTITPALVGPHGKTHGGAIMALAEAALAAATHAYGTIHLALNVNVTFHQATTIHDRLCAEVEAQRVGGRVGGYGITITNQNDHLVATCQAVVYKTRQSLLGQP